MLSTSTVIHPHLERLIEFGKALRFDFDGNARLTFPHPPERPRAHRRLIERGCP